MAIALKRDSQHWIYDWMVKETGRFAHFQGDGRGGYPASVRQHDMLSKHLARGALRLERLGHEELAAGHRVTAIELFYAAASLFGNAQHPILETNDEKRLLHGRSIAAYDTVRDLSPYPLERHEIPWGDAQVYANVHFLPGRPKAPCVIFIPGCDQTKEMYPNPLLNHAHQRGMHIVSVDGPGQGECNIDGTKLTADNYESAISAVIDHLGDLDEVDSDAIALWGLSFGSFWGTRTAARDHRLAAYVGSWASICDKRHLMDTESPRFKRLFAYLTKAESEEQLDAIIAEMSLDDDMAQIECPTLLTVGEYDPRSPLTEVVELYERMRCERELWIFEDQHHVNTTSGSFGLSERGAWNFDTASYSLDWLADRIAGQPVRLSGEALFLRASGAGPYADDPTYASTWIEAAGLTRDQGVGG